MEVEATNVVSKKPSLAERLKQIQNMYKPMGENSPNSLFDKYAYKKKSNVHVRVSK